MAAAKAQAIFRDLMMVEADSAADAAALARISLWALTVYSPIVAVDGIDGIVMDTEGADHLQGGEQPMLERVANQFRAKGLTARVAIADTWGAAHACARAINRETVIVPRGEIVRAGPACLQARSAGRRKQTPARHGRGNRVRQRLSSGWSRIPRRRAQKPPDHQTPAIPV